MPRLVHRSRNPAAYRRPSLALMRGGLPGARWIDPENYHLTLRFIGDIDDALAHDIAGLLGRVQRASFELRLDGLTSFGGRKPRALVAAVTAPAPLLELQAEQERLLQRVGLEPEGRKYTPHVTLARLRDSSSRQVADYLTARGHYRSASFEVTRFRVVLVALVGRRRALCRRGGLSACRRRCRVSRTAGFIPAARELADRLRAQHARLQIEHRGGEAVMVRHHFAASRTTHSAAPIPLRRRRCRNRTTARRRTCAPAAACAGCRRGRPCAAGESRDCGRRAACGEAARSRRRGSAMPFRR